MENVMAFKKCSKCDKKAVADGQCNTHYQQKRRFLLGEGRDPDAAPAERRPHQIATRVNSTCYNLMVKVLAQRAGTNQSIYELAQEWLEERADKENKND